MIDQETIKQYPSLIARPYLLIKDDFQRKDMQRFWFENTISFLAVLSAAELIGFYKELKSREDKTPKDLETIKILQENKSLTMVGLEHMALGKWVMMLRETTKVLQDFEVATNMPELVGFYQGSKGKENAKIIDKLVSIRNDDAHGNPIPEDRLNFELDKRQKLIDALLQELEFLKNYRLILPEKLEIEGSKQLYICKNFIGESIVNIKEEFDFSPQLSEVMLINTALKSNGLPLNPLLLYLGIQDEENNFLGIFSKFTSKDSTEAKYLNLDGSATIDLVNFGQDQEIDLISQRQSYSEIYSDPESFQVNLELSMELEEEMVNINEENSFHLTIDNRKSTDIEQIRIVVNLPKNIEVISFPEDEPFDISVEDAQLIIELSNFEDNEGIKVQPVKFTVSEQGSYNFDNIQVLYSYYRSLADKESGQLTEEDIQYDGSSVEVRDPNSRDKMVPVININKQFVDVDGGSIQNIKIGDDFIFKVQVSNIGFSAAKNVTIDLVFPDNISLKQGKETIKLGQLNPFEERNFEYVLNSHTPDIYTISMQNILYLDSQGVRYATRCADDHFIVVRSDLVKEFIYVVKDHIDDLYIDGEEKKNIKAMIEKLDNSIDVSAYEIYKEAETEAVIEIIRDLVEKTAAKKELKIVEKVYEEGKRDSKITGSDPRKFLVFSSREMPFFAINLSKGYEPELFSIRSNINNRFDEVKTSLAVVADGSYTLDHCVNFSDIKYNEQYGMNFFKQWLNIVLARFRNEYITWKHLAESIGKTYGAPMSYLSGQISKYYENTPSLESGSRVNHVLMDRDNSQSYFVCFDAPPTHNFKSILKTHMLDKKYFLFLDRLNKKVRDEQENVRLYNSRILSYYIQNNGTEKITKFPAVSLKVKNDKSIKEIRDKTKEMWSSLCLAHSLDLLEADEFQSQKFLDEIKQFVYDLFERGFALRENSKNKDMLDIYPLKYLEPHTATELDCIGFIKKYHTSWQIYLDFFEDNADEMVSSSLSLISSNSVSDKVRWLKSDIQNIEQLSSITQTILSQAEMYEPYKLAIWPKNIQREMILNYGQTDTGFFIILKNLLSGKNSYEEILEEFKSMHLDKELDRTLQRSELFETDAGYESPFYIEDNGDDKTISYKPYLEDTLKELLLENPKFSYLEEGSALFRIYTRQISQGHELLSNRSPANSGYVDFSIKKINSKYFNTCWIGLNPLKGQRIEFYNVFNDCKKEGDEKIKEKYSSLNQKFDNKLSIKRSGRRDQHVKVSYIYEFTDFDTELEKMREICHRFIVESVNIIESFNE